MHLKMLSEVYDAAVKLFFLNHGDIVFGGLGLCSCRGGPLYMFGFGNSVFRRCLEPEILFVELTGKYSICIFNVQLSVFHLW